MAARFAVHTAVLLCLLGQRDALTARSFGATDMEAMDLAEDVHLDRMNFTIEHAVVTAADCDAYMEEEGCGWTSIFHCPGQASGFTTFGGASALTIARNDGSLDFRCCCELGLHDKEQAQKGTQLVLREKANHCKALSAQNPEVYQCKFTEEYACPDQFRSGKHVADAGGDFSDEYMCCCVMGYWKVGVKRALNRFEKSVRRLANQTIRPMFVHIPKNAGTAIEEVSGKHGLWYPRKWVSFWHGVHMPDGATCEKYHVPPQYLSALGETDQWAYDVPGTFCVTRHPYERVVSEYLYQLSVPWGPYMSEQYRTGLLKYPKCSKEGLNHFVKSAVTKVAEGRKFLHDCHFVPQAEYIFGHDGKRWCNHPLRFNSLPESFNALMEQYGEEIRMGKEKTNNSTKACGISVTTEDLDDATKLLIQKVYKDDFELLHFSPDGIDSEPAQ